MTNSLLEYGSAIESFEATELAEIVANFINLTDIEAFLNLAESAI